MLKKPKTLLEKQTDLETTLLYVNKQKPHSALPTELGFLDTDTDMSKFEI